MEPIRVAVLTYKPYIMPCTIKYAKIVPHENCSKPGADAEILALALNLMRIAYRIIPVPRWSDAAPFGTLVNGSFTGVLGAIQNGTIDLLANDLIMDDLTPMHVTFSFPIGTLEPVFIVRRPDLDLVETIFIPFETFGWDVWACFCAILIFMIFCAIAVQYCLFSRANNKIFNYVQFMQGHNINYLYEHSYSGRILLILIGLTAVLLTNLYQGTLLTHLLIPRIPKPFANAEQLIELIAEKQISLVIKGNWYRHEIEHSERSYYKKLRNALSINPEVLEPSEDHRIALLASGKYVYGTSRFKSHIYRSLNCKLMDVGGLGIPHYLRGFVHSNDWKLAGKLNEKLIVSEDYAANIWRKYSAKHSYCAPKRGMDGGVPLSLMALSGFFALFLGLQCLAVVSVIWECLKSRSKPMATERMTTQAQEDNRYWRAALYAPKVEIRKRSGTIG